MAEVASKISFRSCIFGDIFR